MSESTPELQELQALLDRVRENEASADDRRRISELVLGDAALRRFYLRQTQFYASLHWYKSAGGMAASAPAALREAPPAQEAISAPLAWGLPVRVGRVFAALNQPLAFSLIFAAAALFAGVTLLGVLPWNQPVAPLRAQAPLVRNVARVIALRDCRGPAAELETNTALVAGERLELSSGLLALSFPQGVEVLVEGPARVRVDSGRRAYLEQGQLTVRVPSRGTGFVIDTPSGAVADLGTEFGVQVDAEGVAEVHVFSGKVRFTPHGAPDAQRELTIRQALRYDARRAETRLIAARVTGFVRGLPDQPPTLLGFYPFDGDARDAGDAGRDATTIEQVEFVAGFEGQAARFAGRAESYLDLPIDASAEYAPRMTWGAWVRPTIVDGAEREFLSTDNGGYDRVLGLDARGELGYSWAAFTGHGVLPHPGPRPEPGRWVFVAAVYNQPRRMMHFYLAQPSADGAAVELYETVDYTSDFGPSESFVRVGRHASHVVAPFVGEVDNLFLFSDALSRKQIQAICDGGQAAIFELAGLKTDPPSAVKAEN